MGFFASHCAIRAVFLLFCLVLACPQTAPAAGKWGKLYVETDPPDAKVRFLRIKYDYEPGIILRQGRYVVEVSKPGFEPVLKEVEVYAGKRNVVHVSLLNPGLGPPPVKEELQAPAPEPAPKQEVNPEKDLRIPLSKTIDKGEAQTASGSGQNDESGEDLQRFDRGFGDMPRPISRKKQGDDEPQEPVPAQEPAPQPAASPAPQPAADTEGAYSGQLPPVAEETVQQTPIEKKQPLSAPASEDGSDEADEAALPEINEDNPPSPEELMQVANHLTQAGDLPTAIEGFNLVLKQQPKNVNAYVGRGFAYYKLGNFAFAVADMTKALELDQQHLSAWFHRGNAYLMAGDFEKAVKDYEQALSINDTIPDIYNARGTALYNMGSLEAAIRDFDRASKLDPEYADAYFNRGSSYLKLGKAQLALDDFNRVLSLKPGDGLAQKKKKEAEKALWP